MDSFFSRYAGNWNQNEETYEKWLSRAASIAAAAMGFPIPANLIDKGIDAAQWLYRKAAGPTAQPLPPQSTDRLADIYKSAPGVRPEETPPPLGVFEGHTGAPPYWNGYNVPGWIDPYAAYPAPARPARNSAYGGRQNRT